MGLLSQYGNSDLKGKPYIGKPVVAGRTFADVVTQNAYTQSCSKQTKIYLQAKQSAGLKGKLPGSVKEVTLNR